MPEPLLKKEFTIRARLGCFLPDRKEAIETDMKDELPLGLRA